MQPGQQVSTACLVAGACSWAVEVAARAGARVAEPSRATEAASAVEAEDALGAMARTDAASLTGSEYEREIFRLDSSKLVDTGYRVELVLHQTILSVSSY